MKKFFDLGNLFAQSSDWKDFALTKFCLFSMGIIIGCLIPKGFTKLAIIIAGIVFIATYIPLMAKLYRLYKEKSNK